ncbi:MAG: beta-propeller fold lactonase family protein, partial [Acidobacteriota bacterium]
IGSDGSAIYALSESGFLILPVGQVNQNPVAALDNRILLLGNDQCGVTAGIRTQKLTVRNEGRGRLTASAILLQAPVQQQVPGLGGAGGPGGGAPGITIPVVLQPLVGAAVAGQTQQQTQITQTAPRVRPRTTPDGTELDFEFNPLAARATGTIAPHDFLIQSPESVNVITSVRVFQNNRDAEARADIIPVQVAISPNEGLVDIVPDNNRRLLYISNSGMNRIEVFDTRTKRLLAPIKVGQLPRSISLAPDGNTLYVGNTGAEYISVVDLDQMSETGKIRFPPLPFNTGLGVINPSVVAATQRGLQIVMSNGTLWKTVGDVAVPRTVSPLVGSSTVPAPRTLVSTPNGEYALLLDGNGYALLYDSLVDEFVQRRQVITAPIQGYYGAVGAGPRGNYFLVNGMVLNQSLTATANAGSTLVTVPGRGNQPPQQFNRPVSAVAAAGTTLFARFIQPVVANANVLVSEPPTLELVDVNTGQTTRTASVLEGPLSTQVGTQRVNVAGRALAVDSSGNTAYALTTSGLSIIPLDAPVAANRPQVNRDGVVNIASFVPGL